MWFLLWGNVLELREAKFRILVAFAIVGSTRIVITNITITTGLAQAGPCLGLAGFVGFG